ncbi:MAG: DUF3048 domain-containing protein [Armatimonadota bacterium]
MQRTLRQHMHRGRWIIFLVIALLGVLLAGCRFPTRGEQHTGSGNTGASGPVCPIDGLSTSEDKLMRRPLAVLVENSPQARPQTGLDKACAVYETITEGGITRFLAIYLHEDPAVIGPVRSVRPHFIDLAREYNAAIVHCGESYEALQILAMSPQLYNLDQMKYPKPFWRDRTRIAPHNLYTSSAKLREFMVKEQWEGVVSQVPGFVGSGKIEAGNPATKIAISFGGAVKYKLRFEYDQQAGGYRRYMDGKLHIDRVTGKPLIAKNIIIQMVATLPFAESSKGTYDVRVVSNGSGYFITGGEQTPLHWDKPGMNAITQYTTDTGKSLPFQSGQTWIELVPLEGTVQVIGSTQPPLPAAQR